MRLLKRVIVGVGISVLFGTFTADGLMAQGRGGRGGQQSPLRDAMRQVPAGTGVLAGRVVAADTGRPIKRARVVVTGAGRPFSTTTDDEGRFRIETLPAARYTMTASKTGYVDAVHGQRRPGSPGVPMPLGDGQQIANIDMRLTRGGVITGHVVDEDGEPLAQAIVTIHRQQYVRGERQLTAAGVDQSDDRGQFRVFGLPPGDYFVSAAAGGIERLAQQFLPMLGQTQASSESTGYASTYYPGVIAAAEAARMRLQPGQELTGIDFPLQLVPLATVRGVVTGGPATVMLLPEGAGAATGPGGGRGMGGGRGGLAGMGGGGGIQAAIGAAIGGALRGGSLRASTQADGTFVIHNVTPGRYTAIARSGEGPGSSTAVQPVTVAGAELTIALSPAPGVSASGSVTLEASGANMPGGFSGFRISLTPLGAAAAVPRPARPAQADGRGDFSATDLVPGHYLITGAAPRGWTMKAVYVDGRDATDQAVEIGPSHAAGINVIFTDRITALSGTVRDGRGGPVAGLTVVAFADDETSWHSHSRYILTARTDQNGAYRLGPLPPAEYLIVATDDVEPGEWFDPAFLERMRKDAVNVRLHEGDQRVQDLRSGGP